MLPDVGRVAYVVKRFPRYSETFIVNEILAHEAAGLEIEIFSIRPPNDTHFQDLLSRVRAPVHYLPSEALRAPDLWSAVQRAAEAIPDVWQRLAGAHGNDARDVYQGLLLAREIRIRRISHIHAHFAGLTTSVTRLAALFSGVPFTFTAHAKDIFHEAVSVEDLRRKMTDAAATVTVSDYNVEHLKSVCGSAAERTVRIYNGIDLDRFTFHPPEDRSSPLRIVGVGRLVEKKGFADLIRACALLARSRSVTCEIIGTGELENELRNMIAQHELSSHVRLLGPRPQAEVIEAVRNAAIFAAPCIVGSDGNRDGLPTTLLEAMALGTPCIATDVTAIPEVIRDGVTGILVRQGDVTGLANGLMLLLSVAELRAKLAREARALIEREFNIHANTARLRSLFGVAVEPIEVGR
jgi:colanic acid/amylovoran biosynthesis glycosyltransferase